MDPYFQIICFLYLSCWMPTRIQQVNSYREYIRETVILCHQAKFFSCFEDNYLISSELWIPQIDLFGVWLKCLILTRCKYTGLKQVLDHQSARAEGSETCVTSSDVWKCAEEEAFKRTLAALCFIQNFLCIFCIYFVVIKFKIYQRKLKE